jgi:hypothetical protein
LEAFRVFKEVADLRQSAEFSFLSELEDSVQNDNVEVTESPRLILPPLQEDNILVISPAICTQLGSVSDPYNQDSRTGSNEGMFLTIQVFFLDI